jgi:hypothetical protein|tara:strand:- start:223 stop:804 length:582 start_codon:yes stop_codon:yes gene_type:complete
MKHFKTYVDFINEAQSWNSVAKVMDKALKKAKVSTSYAKDYVKSLERMAKLTSKKFFDEYGDFTEADFIEDVEYNMANEAKAISEELKGHAKKMKEDGISDEEIKKMHPEVTDEDLNEAYSDEQRMELADKGFALSDGSYPIKNLQDLKNAIMAYGRAKDQAKTAKFIVKRAKALGAEDLIPDSEDFQKSLKA